VDGDAEVEDGLGGVRKRLQALGRPIAGGPGHSLKR